MKTTPSKKRFSFLRLSLRFLLLIVFLTAFVLGWLLWKIQIAKAERRFTSIAHVLHQR